MQPGRVVAFSVIAIGLMGLAAALPAFGYLVLYNGLFVLPLIAILLLASGRPTLNRLAHWNLHHKERGRLCIGTGVVAMGFTILATI